MDNDHPQAIDYERIPVPKRSNPDGGAIIAGTLVGLFGSLMLVYGIVGSIFVIHRWKKADGEDVFEVAVILFIGVLCICAACRWFEFGPWRRPKHS